MSLKNEFNAAGGPVSRLIGHSLASAFGFCGIALVSLIPIGVVRLLILAGLDQLAEPLHALEWMLLIADIALFALVFLSGMAVFTTEIIATTIKEMRKLWKEKEHE